MFRRHANVIDITGDSLRITKKRLNRSSASSPAHRLPHFPERGLRTRSK